MLRRTTRRIALALCSAAISMAALSSARAEDAAAPDAKALWDKNCASCHGADGKAKVKMGEMLKVRDLTDPAVHATLTRDNVLKGIKDGVKNPEGKVVMKGYTGKLSDAEMTALADYVMALK
jgi:cytochrome c553